MKFFQGSDMATSSIIPYLKTLGVKQLDKVIISHPDLDHRGGLDSLGRKYRINQLIVDDPSFYGRGEVCSEFPKWMWDGVSFRFFPLPKSFKSKNNQSCVLQVNVNGKKMLLTGDIERVAEQYLVKTYGEALRSSVLLVPHHSSKTSSSPEFLQEIQPNFAVSSYGFDNRYHFPHAKTVETYKTFGIPVLNTADCGKVSIRLSKRGSTLLPHK